MPELSSNTVMGVCYPTESLYSNWCDHAESLDMSTSEFIIRMVETGRKDISMDDAPDESIRELRQQLVNLQQELERQRERNRDLEDQLQHTAHADIVTYVEENPGVTTPQIIQRVADTVPERVVGHLDLLEGDTLEVKDGAYYLQDSEEDTHSQENKR